MTSVAQRAMSVTDFVGTVAGEASKVGKSVRDVATFLSGVKLVSSLVPGLSTVIGVLDIAQPWIEKIAAAAPVVHTAIEKGAPIIDAVEEHGAEVMPYIKQVLAIAINGDPARPETNLSAADVTNKQASDFAEIVFTPGRTNEEQRREWDRAQGQS